MTLVLTGFQLSDPVTTVRGDVVGPVKAEAEVKRKKKKPKKNVGELDEVVSRRDLGESSDSSATLEDVLDATLADNVILEEDEESDSGMVEQKLLLNRTPLRNGVESPGTPDSGETVRRGSIGVDFMPMLGATTSADYVTKETSSKSNTLGQPHGKSETPMSMPMLDQEFDYGYGYGTTPVLATPKLSPPAKVTTSHKKSTSNVESSPRGLGISNNNNLATPTSVSTGHSRKSSVSGTRSSVASPSKPEEKKSSRSLSRKINNLFSSKKSNPHSRTPSADMDTHSGWGVAGSNTTSKSKVEPQVTPRTKKPTDRRGKSDSLILNAFHLDKNNKSMSPPPSSHLATPKQTSTASNPRRTPSGANSIASTTSQLQKKESSRSGSVGIAFNVTQPLTDDTAGRPNIGLGHRSSNSMGSVSITNSNNSNNNSLVAASIYRTPPLNTLSAFEKSTAPVNSASRINLRTGLTPNKEERRVSTIFDLSAADDGLDSPGTDLYSNELLLRKLKIEIRELNATKKQLRDEIEKLTLTKDSLTHEVENIKHDKEKSSMSSFEIFDTQTGDVQSDTSRKSSASTNRVLIDSKMEPRPKFWKIFGSNSRNGNSYESQSGSNSLDTVSQNQMTLVEVCEVERTWVPLVIRICLAQLESNNSHLKSEGLYRKSASSVLVESIEKEMNEVDNFFVENPTQDVLEAINGSKLLELMEREEHAVAGVLKRYLRHFPEPLLMYDIYEPMMNLVKRDDLLKTLPLSNGKVPKDYVDEEDKEEKGKLFRTTLGTVIRLLNELPRAHYETLKTICRHLILVSSFSEKNLMTIRNLAIVFSPSLISDENGDKDFTDMKERYYIIEFILGQEKEIFD